MTVSTDGSIEPSRLAFDIDGVVADTMAVFVDLARDRYGLTHLTKEHLTSYNLYRCLDVDRETLDELICLTLDDEHTELIPPEPGAPKVLTELAEYGPLRFITARVWPESISRWLHRTLSDVPGDRIQVIATGDPEAKLKVLRELGVQYFVEDRIETCEQLALDGVTPFLFDQPWNRVPSPISFARVQNWTQLRQLILPPTG
jgi:uncharacterized HAD superfamily protein